MIRVLLALLALLLAAAHPAGAAEVVIGYVELTDDARYDAKRAPGGLTLKPAGRPFAGAELALAEAGIMGATASLTFALARTEGSDAAALAGEIARLRRERGIELFLLDLPDDLLSAVAGGLRGADVLLFNVSATGDALRGAACAANLMHVAPNVAMLTDAMAQFLAFKQWRDVLVLEGPRPDDTALVEALARSAKRFGLKLVDRRKFVVSNDSRERDRNNFALLTAGIGYDVVYVADIDGEFGRMLPYDTLRPRPVVGTAGLAATAWHWAWERSGAPQLGRRFLRQSGRTMQATDWAAWAGVRAIAEAAIRTGSATLAPLRDHLKSDRLALDGFKGPALSFRPWDNQLRQPIFLATHDWVVTQAPLRGFLHASNNLDTLGFDRAESQCKF